MSEKIKTDPKEFYGAAWGRVVDHFKAEDAVRKFDMALNSKSGTSVGDRALAMAARAELQAFEH